MRFVPEGPSIPEELLEQCDNGNVVFLCGAGVSQPARLPTFPELTTKVAAALGAADHPSIRRLTAAPDNALNLDEVFSVLQHDFGWREVEREVTRILRTPRHANVEPHSIVLRLSKSATSQPQIVTTNFDLLFERAAPRTTVHVAPSLPDLSGARAFQGIVYLHGRCVQRANDQQPYPRLILSSSDLGRAYLADAWATRFIRDLLQTYYIVLLGYRASDPPVRYLLEGLRSRHGKGSLHLYAFDSGSPEDVTSHWRELGVRALPYPKTLQNGHVALGNTLREWARRRDDPDAWRRVVVASAQNGPTSLHAYQRGQVASLVRTREGRHRICYRNSAPARGVAVRIRQNHPLRQTKHGAWRL